MNLAFYNFLSELGFSGNELRNKLGESDFNYKIEGSSLSVRYIHTPSESDIFESHQQLWNKNSDAVFIAVSDEKSHLINVKEKPDRERPLKKSICIKSFDYGINSKGFEGIDLCEISKSKIDSAYFFDFVSKNQRKGQTVDKDLLLNLLALKSNLIKEDNEQIVHLLILRCLFIKYLEDRGIFKENYLLSILESGKPNGLKAAFDQVARINGDIFKYDQFSISDIESYQLTQLTLFFKYDYQSGQQRLFPYQFDKIPIQLISHVYEAFLKGSTKKGDGIYYTPDFLVDFMLSQSFAEKLKHNPKATIMDPAVGSGAFLVQAFQMIQRSHGNNLDFDTKKEILKKQLFGSDVDRNALQITAFSLYLALLETEDPNFIKAEIERANPILPNLIGKTLISGNTILEDVFPEQTFDCIVSNPPWGSVPTDSEDPKVREVYKKEREAIDNKSGHYREYRYVANYERSQAFIARVSKWGNMDTSFVMVVKNSIFLNDKSLEFRRDILNRYQIDTFYELSHYNKILFKKSPIGEVDGKKIELGASEPCAVLIFQKKSDQYSLTEYISPKLTRFGEHFEIIHATSSDRFELKQSEFIENDSLWKVLVNGDIESHHLIVVKLKKQKSLEIEARSGFKPQKNMIPLGEPIWKYIVEPTDFVQYYRQNRVLNKFNWNQNLERRRNDDIFKGSRIIITVRPLKSDAYLFRGLYLENELVYKHNILSIKVKKHGSYIDNYLPYLGVINSKLFGFLFYQLSTQWGKGDGKRDTLRNVDVERLPLKEISNVQTFSQMTNLVETIQDKKSNREDCQYEIDALNELVFDLYELLDYEKEIIKEFYDVKVNRAGLKESLVRASDIEAYYKAFKDAFSLLLSKEKTLNASYRISSSFGAVICFSIDEKSEEEGLKSNAKLGILDFVKSKQLSSSESLKVLFQEKVKVYDKEQGKFYLIKSNQFKDWTVRQAIKDAKEEIDAILNQLP